MKSIQESKNGKPFSSIIIEINKDGKYLAAQENDSANKLRFYCTDFSENDYGQLTEMKRYKPDSTLSSTFTSDYDKQIFKGSESKDSVGKVTYKSSLKSDDKNNVIEMSSMEVTKDSTTNKVIKYKYDSYDDKGNWTQRTQMDGSGKPTKIERREITYYKD